MDFFGGRCIYPRTYQTKMVPDIVACFHQPNNSLARVLSPSDYLEIPRWKFLVPLDDLRARSQGVAQPKRSEVLALVWPLVLASSVGPWSGLWVGIWVGIWAGLRPLYFPVSKTEVCIWLPVSPL